MPLALADSVLPVGREVRLHYALVERIICEVAFAGTFYTHTASLFLRSAIKRGSVLTCLRPLALSQNHWAFVHLVFSRRSALRWLSLKTSDASQDSAKCALPDQRHSK